MDRDLNKQTQASSDRGLCVKGCGFFGNSSFDGMCSMCFKDFQRRQKEKTQLAAGGVLASASSVSSSVRSSLSLSPKVVATPTRVSSRAERLPVPSTVASLTAVEKSEASSPSALEKPAAASPASSDETPGKRKKARCYVESCRARLGLMGFDCRCGHKFCSKHRYSDQHDCTFDYKTDGRAALEKSNPACIAAKVQKL